MTTTQQNPVQAEVHRLARHAASWITRGQCSTPEDALEQITRATEREIFRRQVLSPSHPLSPSRRTSLEACADLRREVSAYREEFLQTVSSQVG